MASAKSKLVFDKTEMCLVDETGKNPCLLNLTYDKITNVTFDHGTMPYFKFFKKPSDRIVISIRGKVDSMGLPLPCIYYSAREGAKFQEYLDGLRKFCKDNRITVYDQL